ncbi:MAG: hypothetical protein R3185_04470 [Candidatus Thermoplasmatota archaeon]|nr:hypothetical protein [Candidatus Thermoplasmatota archaeon]
MHPARTLTLACLLLVLLGPAAFAQTSTELVFTDATAYRLHATLELRGEEAWEHRQAADDDGNGTVTGEEVSLYKARLQQATERPEASRHRLSGEHPASIETEHVRVAGLAGPTRQGGPMTLELWVRYSYELAPADRYTFSLSRGQDQDPLEVNATGPPGWRFGNVTGLEDASLAQLEGPAGDRERLTGTANGTFSFTLVDPSGAHQTTSQTPEGSEQGSPAGNASDPPAGPSDPRGDENASDPGAGSDEAPRGTPGPATGLLLVLALLVAHLQVREPPPSG